MSRAKAICEEFCEQVVVGTRLHTDPLHLFAAREEFKCFLGIGYFTPLVDRMVEVGYCCTQVQKDLGQNKCTAWFEPMSDEGLV